MAKCFSAVLHQFILIVAQAVSLRYHAGVKFVTKTLLLEIGTEEMPARFMMPALTQLQDLLGKTLTELRLPHGWVRTLGTPRRLSAIVADVAEHQTPVIVEVRGPAKHIAFDAEGRPTRAAEGFAKAQGVAVADLVVKATDKGEFVFAIKRDEGQPALTILANALPQVICQLSFPKMMRWEVSNLHFGRPIRWLVALLGDEEIPFELAGVCSGRFTFGRRFTEGQSMGKRIELLSADDYEVALRSVGVVVDHQQRRELVKTQVQMVTQKFGGVAVITEELLDEVTFLLEEPFVLVGSFDERYLQLPPEILITVMQHHQRYFPGARGYGTQDKLELLPYFVFVCNGKPANPDLVQQGNEKVLAARFEDARFYFAEDRKHRLEDFVPKLNDIVFQQGLGTMVDKTERLKRLVLGLVIGHSSLVIRAAELCKADLATRLVNEFTELQGVVGRIYALLDGEPKEVAEAIEDHYKPLPPDYELPRNSIGTILAIADRLDTLCSCFDRNLVPTGSHDPLGLRRAATTLLMLLRRSSPVTCYSSLPALLDLTLRVLADANILKSEPQATKVKLLDFLRERMDGLLEADGIDHDLRRAVLAVGFDDVAATFARAHALQQLRWERAEWFNSSVVAFTRITNILAQARQKGEAIGEFLRPELFESDTERNLNKEAQNIAPDFELALQSKDYKTAFEVLTQLVPIIHRFFDEVLVMHEDEKIRLNRLSLLRQIELRLLALADFRLVVT